MQSSRRIRKTSQERGSQLVSQRRNFGETQSNFFLTLGKGGLPSTRSAASCLNLPFENAKCVYSVNNLRRNIHLKEDIH